MPSHEIDQIFSDRHSKSCPLNIFLYPVGFPCERFEDSAKEFLFDSDPVILYGEYHMDPAVRERLIHADAQTDISPFRRVLYSIGQQIKQHLTYADRITPQLLTENIMLQDRKSLPLGICQRQGHDIEFIEKLLQIEHLDIENCFAAFDFRHIQHIIDDTQKMMACSRDFTGVVPYQYRVIGIFPQQRGKSGDGIQWSAEIMGHIGQKTTFGFVGTFCDIQRQFQLHVVLIFAAAVRNNQQQLLITTQSDRIQRFVIPAVFFRFLMDPFGFHLQNAGTHCL